MVREALVDPLGHREAVQDHPHAAREIVEHPTACRPRPPGCGSPAVCRSGRASSICAANARSWSAPRGALAVVVEPGLADRDAPRVRGERLSSARSASSNPVARSGGARSPPNLREILGRLERRPARAPVDPDRDHPLDPCSTAASTSSASGGSQRSRWVWLSITRASGNSGSSGRRARANPRPAATRAPRRALRAGRRHVRLRAARDVAQALDQRRERLVELGRIGGIARELPRRPLLDVAVQPPHPLPMRSSAPSARPGPSAPRPPRADPRSRVQPGRSLPGHHAVAVALDHRDRTARQVPVLVRQLGVVPRPDGRRSRPHRRCRTARRASGRSAARRCRTARSPRTGRARCPATCSSCARRRRAGSRGRTRDGAPRARPPSAARAKTPCGT